MATSETPTQRLARSLFGFSLLATAIGVVAWLAIALSPISPDTTFAQLRTVIIVGFGIIVLALMVVTVWSARTDTSNLYGSAERFAVIFRIWFIAVIATIILFELNILAASALRDVAPAIVEPLRFALGGWTLVVILMLITLQWETIKKWFSNTSTTWANIGFAVVLLSLIGIMFSLTAWVVQQSGINNRLRGGLDYREITFIDDGNQPTSQVFWQEQSQTRVRWLPYSYWVVDDINGAYITVSQEGIRFTPDYVPNGQEAPVIAVFGGSTVWGEGARDAYTIPSQIAKLVADSATPYHVVNYGQTGYVSTQDLILFQMQLLQGNTPDIAIFYGGFNDVLSAYTQNITGLTLQESNRISDSEAGRTLRAGQPIVRPINSTLDVADLTLVTNGDGSAEKIVERYLATVNMIDTLASGYGVKVLFVWQPTIVYKHSLVGGEVGADTRMRTERAGFAELYREADEILRQKLSELETPYNLLILSDLFIDDERPIFYDLIHITEEGNLSVAQAIIPRLMQLFEQ